MQTKSSFLKIYKALQCAAKFIIYVFLGIVILLLLCVFFIFLIPLNFVLIFTGTRKNITFRRDLLNIIRDQSECGSIDRGWHTYNDIFTQIHRIHPYSTEVFFCRFPTILSTKVILSGMTKKQYLQKKTLHSHGGKRTEQVYKITQKGQVYWRELKTSLDLT